MFVLQNLERHQVTFFSPRVWKNNQRVQNIVEIVRQTPMMDFGCTTTYSFHGSSPQSRDRFLFPIEWIGAYHSVSNPAPPFYSVLEKAYKECAKHTDLCFWCFEDATLLIMDFKRIDKHGYEEDQRMLYAADDGGARDSLADDGES